MFPVQEPHRGAQQTETEQPARQGDSDHQRFPRHAREPHDHRRDETQHEHREPVPGDPSHGPRGCVQEPAGQERPQVTERRCRFRDDGGRGDDPARRFAALEQQCCHEGQGREENTGRVGQDFTYPGGGPPGALRAQEPEQRGPGEKHQGGDLEQHQ